MGWQDRDYNNYNRIGDARLVLLGEASHGTSEYYRWRMHISQRLIRAKTSRARASEGRATARRPPSAYKP